MCIRLRHVDDNNANYYESQQVVRGGGGGDGDAANISPFTLPIISMYRHVDVLFMCVRISLFQGHQKHGSSGSGSVASEPPHQQPAAAEEDSWFWEPEKTSSSSSSTKTGEVISSKTGSGTDLTLIALDQPSTSPSSSSADTIRLLTRTLEDTEHALKKTNLENALLSEKVKQLQAENREVNENIDELDKQHCVIVENLLAQKTEWQEKWNQLKGESEAATKRAAELAQEKEAKIIVLNEEVKKLQRSYQDCVSELELVRVKLEDSELLKSEEPFVAVEDDSVTELRQELERLQVEKRKIEEDFNAGQDDYLEVQRELEAYRQTHTEEMADNARVLANLVPILHKAVAELQLEANADPQVVLDQMLQRCLDSEAKLAELVRQLEQNDVALATNCDELKKLKHDKEILEADMINYEIQCDELMKNNEKLLEELEQTKCGKLETIPEHSEESLVLLEKQLEESTTLNNSLEEEFQELTLRYAKLEVERDALEGSLKKLDEELRQTVARNEALNSVTISLEEEKSHLTFQLNELQSSAETDDNLQQQVITLTTQLEALQAEYERLVREMADKCVEFEQEKKAWDEEQVNATEERCEELKLEAAAEKQVLEQQLADMKAELAAAKADALEAVTVAAAAAAAAASQREEENNGESELMQAHEKTITNLSATINANRLALTQLEETVAALTKEKNDLIGLVTTKHQESVQYHAEIQKLVALLQQPKPPCEQCPGLQARVNELNAKVARLDELERQTDQVDFLKEKADILTSNLLVEQNLKKMLQKDKEDLEEEKTNLAKDLDRLTGHLLALEEEHTVLVNDLQRQIEEYKAKSTTLEQVAKHASTAYTSASIRANQHTETLQSQYRLLAQQRDDLSAKLSQADDRESKNQAALINLQCALEQFQKGECV